MKVYVLNAIDSNGELSIIKCCADKQKALNIAIVDYEDELLQCRNMGEHVPDVAHDLYNALSDDGIYFVDDLGITYYLTECSL